MSNPFYSDTSKEIGDDEFLNHPRSGYMLQNSRNIGSMPTYNQFSSGGQREALGLDTDGNRDNGMDRVQALMQKRREIEERTVDSSNRSLGLLYESERAGVATAEELNRQKEQLKRTEERLDDINSTLKTSERHLQGIKSVFGGIKNYFSSKNAAAAAGGGNSTQVRVSNTSAYANGNASSNVASNAPYNSSGLNGFENDVDRLDDTRGQNHPGLRTRGLHESGNKSVDDILDSNLDEMSLGIGRLKGLAMGLNQELEEHNDILDRLDDKTAHADGRVKKQNKDMDKLLNPKKK